MNYKFYFTLPLFLLCSFEASAQVGINTDNADPDASAMLDIKSSEKGVLIPRMTSVQRNMISNAAIGLLVFDTTTETFWFNDSGGWTELGGEDTPKEIADVDGDTKVEAVDSATNDYMQVTIENTPKLRMTSRSLEFLNMGNSIYIGESTGTMDDYSNNRNVGIGFESLSNSTNGTENIGIGYQTLKSLTNGQTSIAIGTQVLSKGNPFGCVGIGYHALLENLGGSANVALGFDALKNNTNGNANVAIGTNTLDTNTTGSNNTAIGNSADVGSNNLTNATAIGADAVVSQSNSLVLGSNANIGIGTSTPDDKLHVVGDVKIEGSINFGTNANRKAVGSDQELAIVQGIATQNSDNTMSVTTSTSANVISVVRNAEGTYTVNFAAGAFTLAPAITVTPYLTNSSKIPELSSISSSSFQVIFRNPNGNKRDAGFSFIAVGIAP